MEKRRGGVAKFLGYRLDERVSIPPGKGASVLPVH